MTEIPKKMKQVKTEPTTLQLLLSLIKNWSKSISSTDHEREKMANGESYSNITKFHKINDVLQNKTKECVSDILTEI